MAQRNNCLIKRSGAYPQTLDLNRLTDFYCQGYNTYNIVLKSGRAVYNIPTYYYLLVNTCQHYFELKEYFC